MTQHHLTPQQQANIIEAYEVNLVPMQELASQYDRTRQGIWKVLKKYGIDTSDRQLPVSCSTCDKEIFRHKSRIRKQKNHFCCRECYFAFLEAGNGLPYLENRQGQRIARKKVGKYFGLLKSHIVHHEDRNCFNNRLENLKVFINQGDHVRHHRGFDVIPLWDGAGLIPLSNETCLSRL